MTFPALLLGLNAAVFVGYGVAFAVAPESMSMLITGSSPGTPSGVIDMRSTYGGMSIGLGVLLALAARNTAHHALGLKGVLAVMLGMGATRLAGIATDGDPNAPMVAYLAVEVLVAGLAGWALRNLQGD